MGLGSDGSSHPGVVRSAAKQPPTKHTNGTQQTFKDAPRKHLGMRHLKTD